MLLFVGTLDLDVDLVVGVVGDVGRPLPVVVVVVLPLMINGRGSQTSALIRLKKLAKETHQVLIKF